jgi:hypothetical protein
MIFKAHRYRPARRSGFRFGRRSIALRRRADVCHAHLRIGNVIPLPHAGRPKANVVPVVVRTRGRQCAHHR